LGADMDFALTHLASPLTFERFSIEDTDTPFESERSESTSLKSARTSEAVN